RHRLVGEPARRRQGLPFGLAVDRDLEDEAVPLRERRVRCAGEVGPDVGTVDRLLAADPAAPWHLPTGAVHLRAVEAGVRPDDLAEAGHLDGRGTALGHRVVGLARVAERRAGVVQLVVADEEVVARLATPA